MFLFIFFFYIFWLLYTAVPYRYHYDPQWSTSLFSSLKKSLWEFISNNSGTIPMILQSNPAFEACFFLQIRQHLQGQKVSFPFYIPGYIFADWILHLDLSSWFRKVNSDLCKNDRTEPWSWQLDCSQEEEKQTLGLDRIRSY